MSEATETPIRRVKPANITPTMQTQFQQHWECRAEHDLHDCVHPLYFNPIAQRLQAGDRITVCQFESAAWDKVLALVTVRVILIEDGRVYVKPEGPIVGCDLNTPTVLDGEPAPVTLKSLQGGRIGVVGLEKFGLDDVSFGDKDEAMAWIERNSNSVYLETSKSKAA